jgi:peptidyl-prolyl cis-trans isomerase C
MKQIRYLALAGLLVLSGCKQAGPGSAENTPAAASPPVATVNGVAVSRDFFETYVKGVTGKAASELSAEQRTEALDGLVRAYVVAEQAAKDGLDKEPETAAVIELSRLNILQQASSRKYLDGKDPTEQELRAEYETQVAALPRLEYRARHILVATEDFAKKLIEQLGKGARFEDLARRESIDGSKANGGDLGWFTPDRMVPPFSAAVVALQKGQVTPVPVQTQFGWHVIQLEDTREVAPPAFDAVKDRLVQVVQAKKFRAWSDELMKTAQIEKTP